MLADVQIPRKIAGTGPHEQELRALAHNDSRIEFVGFVSDIQLEELYSHAYAVPFIPEQEDYGLITIEAMQSSKPVITCVDSGGSTEFVTATTGYLCEPTIESLAAAFREAADNPAEARKRGLQAKKNVEKITREKSVQQIGFILMVRYISNVDSMKI